MYPIYYFRVNILSDQELISHLQPDKNLNNIIRNRSTATVWVETVAQELHHGDTFTLIGPTATRTKRLYIDSKRPLPYVLEMFEISDVSGVEVSSNEELVDLEWSGSSEFFTYIEIKTNGEWRYLRTANKGDNSTSIEATEGRLYIRLRFTDGNGNFSRNYTTIYVDVESTEVEGLGILSEDGESYLSDESGDFYICSDDNV